MEQVDTCGIWSPQIRFFFSVRTAVYCRPRQIESCILKFSAVLQDSVVPNACLSRQLGNIFNRSVPLDIESFEKVHWLLINKCTQGIGIPSLTTSFEVQVHILARVPGQSLLKKCHVIVSHEGIASTWCARAVRFIKLFRCVWFPFLSGGGAHTGVWRLVLPLCCGKPIPTTRRARRS